MKERGPQSEREKQTTNTIVMIYPDTFKFNPETADTNSFQKKFGDITPEEANLRARLEFTSAVDTLRKNGVNVLVLHSVEGEDTPDAVFPNNWVSIHNGKAVLYPMRNQNRSIERQPEALLELLSDSNITIHEVINLTEHEKVRKMEVAKINEKVQRSVCVEALEGTGSLVLDRVNKVAYATESPRTSKKVFSEWCQIMGYDEVLFHATNKEGPIYHTNVVMGIGNKFAVICSESIKDQAEMESVLNKLNDGQREIIEISQEQVDDYCGNIIELESSNGEPLIVMSKTSHDSFTPEQRSILASYGKIVALEIPVIETIGGGSARCMIAEVHA